MSRGLLPGWPPAGQSPQPAEDCGDALPILGRHEQQINILCNVVEQMVGATENGIPEFWATAACRDNPEVFAVLGPEQVSDTGIITSGQGVCIEPVFDVMPVLRTGCKVLLSGQVCIQALNVVVPRDGVLFIPTVTGLWRRQGTSAALSAGSLRSDALGGNVELDARFIDVQQGQNTVQGLSTNPQTTEERCTSLNNCMLDTESIAGTVGGLIENVTLRLCFTGSFANGRAPSNDDWTIQIAIKKLSMQVLCPVDFTFSV